tara:strand:+ start:1581 stop:2018 length:438 start_codon:yes stop_codon:yes gene_type:complete
MSLPFKLKSYHKYDTKSRWKQSGLIMDNFEEIYNRYITQTHCELCNKEFTISIDRCMDHNHTTGEFRNIVCNKCNASREDRKLFSNNNSGYKCISKQIDNTCKQGFTWVLQCYVDGKQTKIKSCVNLKKLVKFAEEWKKDNNYYT